MCTAMPPPWAVVWLFVMIVSWICTLPVELVFVLTASPAPLPALFPLRMVSPDTTMRVLAPSSSSTPDNEFPSSTVIVGSPDGEMQLASKPPSMKRSFAAAAVDEK